MKKNIKLLVVDDNTQLRTLIRVSFKKHTHIEVFEAIDGTDGLRQFKEIQPDILISDVMMQGEIDGLSLCQQVKSSTHLCRVILLSGKAGKGDIELGMQAGADFYIVKPFSPIELINVVDKLID